MEQKWCPHARVARPWGPVLGCGLWPAWKLFQICWDMFNSIGKKKKKKVLSGTWRYQIIIVIYEFYWNTRNFAKESCKYFSPEWLRLPPKWKQSLQSSRDNFFLLHCPTDFLKHTEKIVHPLPASREAGKKAMGINFILFQASFSELDIQQKFVEFSASSIWRKDVHLLELSLPLQIPLSHSKKKRVSRFSM